METKIKIAIIGFGNIGRGVVSSLEHNKDIELTAIFSRNPNRVLNEIEQSKNNRSISKIQSNQVFHTDDLDELKKCDVALLCGGSKNDLPKQGPYFAKFISTVDSFDNHSKVSEYFNSIDIVAKKHNNVSIISAGWDPGTFSLERLMSTVIIPNAKTYGFYGLSERGGLSMGHSDAIRTIEGVLDARQYTHANLDTIEKLKNGETKELSPKDMHFRECFVAIEENACKAKIEEKIKTMPGYFAPFITKVNFVSLEELKENHLSFPHDGTVIGIGTVGNSKKALVEYKNVWEDNTVSTAHILVAHARAAFKLKNEGKNGAFTILDIPPAYLSPKSKEELLKNFI